MNIPLLDPTKESQHDTWRLLYAEMMFSWGLFEARAELLKFLTLKKSNNNNLNNNGNSTRSTTVITTRELRAQQNQEKSSAQSSMSSSTSTSMLVKEDQPSALELVLGIDRLGPQILNKCFECESPIKRGNICDFCRKVRVGIKCSICHLQGRGRTTVCLKCAHGGHADHLWEWFIQEKNSVCPTGCGCNCLDHYGGWAGGLGVQQLPQQKMVMQESL
jgi:hypothetical protein